MSYVMYCPKQPIAAQCKDHLDTEPGQLPHPDQLIALVNKNLNLRMEARQLILKSLVVLLASCKVFLQTLNAP